MRRILLYIFLFMIPVITDGQLFVMSDHYVQNALVINPAYAGSQEALDVSVSHRTFWNGFEGSPKTTSLSLHAPFFNERVGLGFFLVNDKIGVTNATHMVGNYAYRINLGYGKLAFGLGAGIKLTNATWGDLDALDAEDDLLNNNRTTGVAPDFSIGVYYSNHKYFMGLSVPLFLHHEYKSEKERYIISNELKNYNYFYHTGYMLDLTEGIQIFPSLLLKYQQENPLQLDVNTHVILKDKVWLGATYRSKNVLVGILQYQFNNQLRIAWSYDVGMVQNEQYMNHSSEIMIHYVFNYELDIPGPRRF